MTVTAAEQRGLLRDAVFMRCPFKSQKSRHRVRSNGLLVVPATNGRLCVYWECGHDSAVLVVYRTMLMQKGDWFLQPTGVHLGVLDAAVEVLSRGSPFSDG